MRILHLIDHLGLGGQQEVVLDLLESRSPDLTARLWSLSDRVLARTRGRLEAAGVPFRSLGLSKANPFGLLRLRSLLARERPDLLHLHLEYSGSFGGLAALSLRRRPRIVASIANDPRNRYRAFHRGIGRILAPGFAAHIAVSPSIRQAVEIAYAGRPRRVEVIPSALDLRRFRARPDPAVVAGWRRGAKRVVGTVARLAEQKGLDLLLAATPRWLAADPETRVLVVGDGPLRSSLERQAGRLGITAAVTFAGYQEDPLPALSAMDVFVLPSRDEGLPVAGLEAMAAGVPVVATRVIGNVDMVEDEVTGLLVPAGDADALVAAVLLLLSRPELARRLADNAARHVRERHARERITAVTEALYRQLLAPERACSSGSSSSP